jgi:hypothetical protein
VLECNCGAYVPPERALCPACHRIVRPELFERLREASSARFEQKMRECEDRFSALATARISPPDQQRPIVSAEQGGPPLAPFVNPPAAACGRRDGAHEQTAWLRELMEEWDLDPDMGVKDLLDLMEEYGVGVDLWTSPKRWAGQRYRTRLYRWQYGSLVPFMEAEAPTAWASLAATVVGAFDQEWLEPA